MNSPRTTLPRPTRLASLTLALLLSGSAFAAEPAPAVPVSPDPDWFSLRLGAFLVTNINTTISLTTASGAGGDLIDFGDTLGGETSVNVFRADADWFVSGPHRVQGAWYDINLNGHRELDREIEWGDETFPIHAELDSGLRTNIYKLSYGYTFNRGQRHEFTGLIGFHVMSLESFISAPGLGRAERFDVTAPLPAIGLSWTAHWTPRFQTVTTVQYFGISVDDKVEGKFVDALFAAEYRLSKHFSVGAGYNYFDLEVDAHRGPLTLSVADRYDGFLVYLGVHF
jgi:hypothetical protein